MDIPEQVLWEDDLTKPSVKGNEIVFANQPDKDTARTIKFGNITMNCIFGSVELVGNSKIFRNNNGTIYRMERFDSEKYRVKFTCD